MNEGLVERIKHAEKIAAQLTRQAETRAGDILRDLADSLARDLRDLDDLYREKRKNLPDLARDRAGDALLEKRNAHERLIRDIRKTATANRDEVIRYMIRTLLE